MVDRFEKLSKDVPFEMKFVCEDYNPAAVQLFVDGLKFEEEAIATTKPKIKAFISEMTEPFLHSTEQESALTSASELPPLDEHQERAV